jgi:hypothetical protein
MRAAVYARYSSEPIFGGEYAFRSSGLPYA